MPGGGTPGRQVLVGLLVGGALSLVAWPLAIWSDNGSLLLALLAVLLLIKVGGGVTLILKGPRTKFAGIGLLISIALGGLIFLGTCGIAVFSSLK